MSARSKVTAVLYVNGDVRGHFQPGHDHMALFDKSQENIAVVCEGDLFLYRNMAPGYYTFKLLDMVPSRRVSVMRLSGDGVIRERATLAPGGIVHQVISKITVESKTYDYSLTSENMTI